MDEETKDGTKEQRDAILADPVAYAQKRAAQIASALATLTPRTETTPGEVSMPDHLTALKAEYEAVENVDAAIIQADLARLEVQDGDDN